ncbi:MAG: biotin/lipoyl-containing protein [candidate division KSB1 bacterium]|nr:biotin/lipoyl-containing protein [candidate division KSB1 bacterium]
MKYSATVDGESFELELKQDENGRVAVVGDTAYAIEVLERTPNHLILQMNGRVYDILLKRNRKEGEVLINGKTCQVQVEDLRLRQLRQLSGARSDNAGPLQIKAPMPGLVLKIQVQEGQHVKRRDGLIIIEAMKMENEIRAELRRDQAYRGAGRPGRG